ncbi:MAG: DNA/RNA non-specific endonuclease [Reichenbachiella sp.]
MAKKKKKGGKGKNSDSSSGNGFLTTIIILVIGGAVSYGLFVEPGENQISDIIESTSEKFKTEGEDETLKKNDEVPAHESSTSERKKNASNENKESSLEGKLEKAETNQNLPSYNEENPYYFSKSFDFTWPAYTNNDAIVEHSFFALRYNEKKEQADWVAYKLIGSNLENAKYKRRDNFREDPKVQTKSAHPNDYKGSGYDRGHLAPAADFTWNKDGLDESFYMSNMSPQLPGFNRGIWKRLEEKTREFAKSNGEIFIVTGPIFDAKSEKIGKNKVAIPDRYYKAIIELTGKETKGIAFVLDHEKSSDDLGSFAISIDALENITALDFFPNLPDQLENEIECCFRYSDW